MNRQAASVVIPVWNKWEYTKACLDSLRPTLGIRDEVVVVDNGSEDKTAAGLRSYSWVKVITNEENKGFAIACNQGAAVATGEVVVFLNNDTILSGRWLDNLIVPLADEAVVATGPRSNFVSGAQMVKGQLYDDKNSMRRFVRTWESQNKGSVQETERLVGFCLAVRRTAFESVGGFDESFDIGGFEDDDLCKRLTDRGGRLLVVDDSFVHHIGHGTFDANGLDVFSIYRENSKRYAEKHGASWMEELEPASPENVFLSACMIVKDEVDILSAAFDSLTNLVDEVVVYDTGSTDGTIELARRAGAKVIEGYWDDDFGRARNAALEECSGQWILHLDADEIVDANPLEIRSLLQNPAAFSAYSVPITNVGDAVTGGEIEHRACRLFRRDEHRWSGRLHEQVVLKDGTPRTHSGTLESMRIIHSGYSVEALEKKGKVERNLRLAEADAASGEGDTAFKIFNVGRSLVMSGRVEEAFARFVEALNHPTQKTVKRNIYRAGAEALLSLGRPQEALDWIDSLAEVSEDMQLVRYLRGSAFLNMGEHDLALAQFEGLKQAKNDDLDYGAAAVHVRRGQAYAAAGRWMEARVDLLAALALGHVEEPIWVPLVTGFRQTGESLDALVAAMPLDQLNRIFGELMASPDDADAVADYLWTHPGSETRAIVMASAIRVAPMLSVERGLEWSARLREIGLAAHCPLITIATDVANPSITRLRAAAIAGAAFNDDRAVEALRQAAGTTPESEFVGVLIQLNNVAPEMLEPFVIGAASTPRRSFTLARALHELGAQDEAIAVCEHGLNSGADSALVQEAEAWLQQVRTTSG